MEGRRDIYNTSTLFKFSVKLEVRFEFWEIYSFSHWPSRLLTPLKCAHFRSEQKGGGGFRLLYIKAKPNLVQPLTSPPTTQLNGPTTGRRILSRKGEPLSCISKACGPPLGGEAPLCTPARSSPCVEGAWRRGLPGEWRTPSGPLPVPGQLSGGRSCSSNHRPLEISGLAGPDTPGESATRASHRPGPCRKG